MAVLGNPHGVEDVAQEYLLRAPARMGQIHDPAAFPPWP